MIDTDKYEGHTEGPWYWDGNLCNDEYSDKHGTEQWAVLDWELGVGDANKLLIADAPLLLIEVKRLREENHNRWVVIGELRRQVEELKADLKDWMDGDEQE